jgi:hypothetical protein
VDEVEDVTVQEAVQVLPLLGPAKARRDRVVGVLTALLVVPVQRPGQLGLGPEGVGQGHRVLQRLSRARRQGEVRGVRGIPHEHYVPVVPGAVGQVLEALPAGGLGTGLTEQPSPAQRPAERLLQQPQSLIAVQGVQLQALPLLRGARDDTGAGRGARRVGVHPDPPGRGPLEGERDAREDVVGAEPDEPVAADHGRRPELRAERPPHHAPHTVGGDDQVGVGELREDVQQGGPFQAGTGVLDVGRPAVHLPLLLLPGDGPGPDLARALHIPVEHRVQHPVGIGDAPAEGRSGQVAFDDPDVSPGSFLAQLAKYSPAGPPPHGRRPCRASMTLPPGSDNVLGPRRGGRRARRPARRRRS